MIIILKLGGACCLGGLSAGLMAQFTPGTAGTPWAVGIATGIGVIGAAVVHLVGRFQLLTSQSEAVRRKAEMQAEADRLNEALKWYRGQNEALEKRASKAEAERDVCRDRLARLAGKGSRDDFPTSPPKSEGV
jgi:hypothetical protein